MVTTSQAMAAYLDQISITEYQKTSIVAGRKNRVVENLTEAFPASSDLPFSRAVLMGSAAKATVIRPIDDIDVLSVFSNENDAWNRYRLDSQAFLYRIRRAYDGLEAVTVGARGQAVRIFFEQGGHVDVAPVFWHGGEIHSLPNGNGGWLNTAPIQAQGWFTGKHAQLGYNLAPLVRLLKKWNRSHSKRLRSFHLESVAAHCFESLGSNRQNALAKFFEWAPSWLDVSDPGGQSGILSGYLTFNARQQVLQSLRTAQDQAARALLAESNGDHEEAKRLWSLILGADFPGGS